MDNDLLLFANPATKAMMVFIAMDEEEAEYYASRIAYEGDRALAAALGCAPPAKIIDRMKQGDKLREVVTGRYFAGEAQMGLASLATVDWEYIASRLVKYPRTFPLRVFRALPPLELAGMEGER